MSAHPTAPACQPTRRHAEDKVEILAVAVAPSVQGQGVGSALMDACISATAMAKADGAPVVWLATAKPSYFARFGFSPIPRFRLPAGVLWTKFRLVFQQPAARWIPALTGRHTFMVRSAA